jgi:hypothetical protein
MERAEYREADTDMEGLQSSTARVWDLVLGGPTETSSLAASLSSAIELEDCVNVTTANRVR